jgi:hypothetical protein
MVRREGPLCSCSSKDPRMVCQGCWATGFIGGYFFYQETDLYLLDGSVLAKADGDTTGEWAARTYRVVEPMDVTHYAVGDFLVDLSTRARWKILAADPHKMLTRVLHPYEPAYRFPTQIGHALP